MSFRARGSHTPGKCRALLRASAGESCSGADENVPGGRARRVRGDRRPKRMRQTTLLNLVGGLLEPSEGEILIDSRPPKAGAPDLGYLFARDCLLGWRTAA